MSDQKSKLSSFFAKKQGKKKFKPVKISLDSVSAVKMDEEDELDAQASLEANPRAAELISSIGWVEEPDADAEPVVHAGSRTVVGFSSAPPEDEDEDDEPEPVDDDIVVHPMDAPDQDDVSDDDDDDASAPSRRKTGWDVPAAPAAVSSEELSKSHFPTLAAAKEVAELDDTEGFSVVGGRRRRRGPASMGPPSGSRGGPSGGVRRAGGWVDSRPSHLRLKTSNAYGSLQ